MFTKSSMITLCKQDENCEQKALNILMHWYNRVFTYAKVKSPESRRNAQGTQAPSDAHTARNRAKTRLSRGFTGVLGRLGGGQKPPRGGFSQGINA